MIIREFDPWKSRLCTCPPKYSLNPYTGCDHRCVYCYITGYITNAFHCRPKSDLLTSLKRELKKIDSHKIISMANSSDPYPQLERKMELTRKVVLLFARENFMFHIVTKSDLVTRDIDVLKDAACAVAITITTMDEVLARRLEPGAPPPEKRVEALRRLKESGIPVSVRIDPIIPGVTAPEEVLQQVPFVDHVTASTLKLRPDAIRRMMAAVPEVMATLKPLYTERIGNALYLPERVRVHTLNSLEKACRENNVSFGTCREGLNSGSSCDGSHLIRDR
ncbi:MAG: radical SAM protein [Theionarchaea archaeon]|nr:radical SAM protein [Theionarchaea archaeon]